MFRKIASVLFWSMMIGIISTVFYVGYFYIEGYTVVRNLSQDIKKIVSEENCLSDEKIYQTDSSGYRSTQDQVRALLKFYSRKGTIKGVTTKYWYLDFDNLEGGQLVGDIQPTGEILSKNESHLELRDQNEPPITVIDSKTGRVLNSYENAVQKGEKIDIQIRAHVILRLRLVPGNPIKSKNDVIKTFNSNGNVTKEFETKGWRLDLPITVNTSATATRYFKGKGDESKEFIDNIMFE